MMLPYCGIFVVSVSWEPFVFTLYSNDSVYTTQRGAE